MVQVLLEEGVVRRNTGHAISAGKPRGSIVSDKGRLDVDDINLPAGNGREDPVQAAPLHAAIFRVLRYTGGRDPQDSGLVRRRALVQGRARLNIIWDDQQRLHAARRQILAERTDGSRYAVDSGEIDVRNEQYAHSVSRALGLTLPMTHQSPRRLKRPSGSEDPAPRAIRR